MYYGKAYYFCNCGKRSLSRKMLELARKLMSPAALLLVGRQYGRSRCLSSLCRPSVLSRLTLNFKLYSNKASHFNEVPVATKDILLYAVNSSRFHFWMTTFGVTQFIFWNYLAVFVQQNVKDIDPVEEMKDSTTKAQPFIYRIKDLLNFENKYTHGISLLLSVLGSGCFLVTSLLSLRSVQMVVLRKGGKTVDVVTSALFGSRRTLANIPLDHVSCHASMHTSQATLPLKLKGRSFYFLLDAKGTFPNPKLFEQTVGLHRKLKKK